MNWIKKCFCLWEMIWYKKLTANNKSCTLKRDRKSTRLNSSHVRISYAVFCLKKKNALRIRYGLPEHFATAQLPPPHDDAAQLSVTLQIPSQRNRDPVANPSVVQHYHSLNAYR